MNEQVHPSMATTNTPDSTTATEASDGSGITSSWDFDTTGINNANGFDLMRQGPNDTSPTLLSNITDPTTTSYTDTTAAIGSTYKYELLPYDLVDANPVTATPTSPQTITMLGMITATPSTDPVVVDSTAATNGGVTQVNISLPFTDSGPTDTHTATIDWGDGTIGSPDTTAGIVELIEGDVALRKENKREVAISEKNGTGTLLE
jgi:hypothetical protein